MSRAEQRARVHELTQTLAAAIIVAAAGLFVVAINGWMVSRFEAEGAYLPGLTATLIAVPWLGLLLLPLFALTVLVLALRQAPRGVVTAASMGFSILAGCWLVIAIFAYSLPLIRMGQ
jgi:hypothetical protein